MSWVKKLVSLLFGDEEETETNDVKELPQHTQEHHTVKNVQSESITTTDKEDRQQMKAVARVSYQYPKGNFRFPIIPDERKIKRDERPRRKENQENDLRIHREKKSYVYKNYDRQTKVSVNEEKEITHTNKRPFHPTAIPSPVYGFQPRDDRMQNQQNQPLNNSQEQRAAGERSESTEEKIESVQFEGKNEIGFQPRDDRMQNQRIQPVNNSLKQNAAGERSESSEEKIESAQFEEKDETGFQPRDERMQNQQIQPVNNSQEQRAAGERSESSEEKIESAQLEGNYETGFQDEQVQNQHIYPENNPQEQSSAGKAGESSEKRIVSAQFEEKYDTDNVVEQVHTEEQHKVHLLVEEVDESLTFEINKNELEHENQHEEDDLVDEALIIVKKEFQKQNDVDQTNIIELSDDEIQVEDLTEENETVFELEELSEEEEQPFEIVQAQNTLIEEQPAPTDEKKDGIVNEQTEESSDQSQATPRRKSVPFNVMMLGRDRQKLREKRQEPGYQFPLLEYLNIPEKELTEDHTWLEEQKDLLNETLKNFNVRASVVNVTQGPSVTRFEVHPEPGVKVNKITNLSDDIKLSLSAKDIRMEAPIPGKNTIGIEVPNKVSKMVYLREILRSSEFRSNPSPMNAVLGLDIAGQPAVTDLKKMPHGLIAGATGSGKSVCINTILVSLLYKASPHEVKLMLIDPKMVELAPYNEIPHLVSPVITDVKAATAALKWAVEEMERRYELFAHSGTREITRYNQLVKEHNQGEHLPYLVIVIDELADLMMVAPNDVEEAICRIAQKARACGIHLIVATQRPSVDVITGLIKANIPTRIAFSVSSQVDSRTIIDVNGAEKLLGKGDMLFLENGSSKAVRLQGTFVSDEEIERVVKHVKLQSKPDYLFHQDELVKKATIQSEEDELFLEACEFVVNQGGASTSSLQRRFRIGYNRAARLIDMMEEQGIISENRGSKPRDVLISEEELDAIQETHVL